MPASGLGSGRAVECTSWRPWVLHVDLDGPDSPGAGFQSLLQKWLTWWIGEPMSELEKRVDDELVGCQFTSLVVLNSYRCVNKSFPERKDALQGLRDVI